VVARGELWWGETPDEKGRPFLVVSRDAANDAMQRVLVAPVTRRVRGVPSELPVGGDEGLPHQSVASFDNLRPVPQVDARAPARRDPQRPPAPDLRGRGSDA